MNFKNHLRALMIFLLSILPITLFISNIQKDTKKTLELSINGMSEISNNLESLFYKYEKDIVNNFLQISQSRNAKTNINIENIENKILDFISLKNNEIIINFDELKSFGLPESIIDIFATDDFILLIKQSIENNIFKVFNNKIIFNESFMLTEEIQIIPMSRSGHRNFWTRSRWIWFGYWRLEMSREGRMIFERISASTLADVLVGSLWTSNQIVPLAHQLSIMYGINVAPILAAGLKWVLIAIGSLILVNIVQFIIAQQNFITYSNGAFLGIYIAIITNWGRL